MSIVESTYLTVKEFKGLHLYHAAISNCSMRVRIVLEEKTRLGESSFRYC